jgi:type IV pilus assembly protein PilC
MIIPFTRQLYILIKAGLPLLKALQIISVQLSKGKFREDIESIIQDIQQGKSFSESIVNHSRFFSSFYINMIKAAEVSGNLVGVLRELSLHLTKHQRISRQIQAAVMYPVFVLVITIIILITLVIFVIPVFIRVFEDLGGRLPFSTLLLINLSRFILRWGWLLFLLGIAVISVILFFFRKSPVGRKIFNGLVWQIPLFGRIIKMAQIARFCRTLGTLLSSGVTLVKGLDVVGDTSEAILLREAIREIRYEVEQGESLSLAMEEIKIFPLTLVRIVQIGEESGKLADLFLDAAEDYEDEVAFAISGLLSILEPALIVVMGGIVGFIVVSLFFPIFTLSGLIK